MRARHLELLAEKLVEAAAVGDRRLVVSMPPRHGKSRLTSLWTPAWYLNAAPDKRVVLASYGQRFANRWGRGVRAILREHAGRLSVKLSGDSQAVDTWDTTEGGGMLSVGIGGPLTGEGADLLLVDDPVKNREEAESPVQRENVWDWWTSTAYTRLEPGASAVVVMTRWHEDDLAGRLLSDATDEEWEEIRIPALAEEGDVLGRQPGEALWPERYPVARLDQIRRAVGPYDWSALYQQRPTPAEGGLFRRGWFRYWRTEGEAQTWQEETGRRWTHAENLTRFATVDLAASTKESADYTVIAVWAWDAAQDRLLLFDVIRERIEAPDLVPRFRQVVGRWDLASIHVERAGFQLAIVQEARRAGLPVMELVPDKDKLSRALPAAAALEGGRVLWPATAPWLAEWERELLTFPNASHDDQTDALAYAVRLANDWRGAGWTPTAPKGEAPSRYDPSVTGRLEAGRGVGREDLWD